VTRSPVYYGWYVVAALFVMLTTASGLAFYNLSVYMNALVVSHGFPVGSVSTAIAVFFVASGLAGLGAARMIQDRDPRWTIAFGGIVGALALLALGRVETLWRRTLQAAFRQAEEDSSHVLVSVRENFKFQYVRRIADGLLDVLQAEIGAAVERHHKELDALAADERLLLGESERARLATYLDDLDALEADVR
jgi:hypothetical protein